MMCASVIQGCNPLAETGRSKLQNQRAVLNQQILKAVRMRAGAENLLRYVPTTSLPPLPTAPECSLCSIQQEQPLIPSQLPSDSQHLTEEIVAGNNPACRLHVVFLDFHLSEICLLWKLSLAFLYTRFILFKRNHIYLCTAFPFKTTHSVFTPNCITEIMKKQS